MPVPYRRPSYTGYKQPVYVKKNKYIKYRSPCACSVLVNWQKKKKKLSKRFHKIWNPRAYLILVWKLRLGDAFFFKSNTEILSMHGVKGRELLTIHLGDTRWDFSKHVQRLNTFYRVHAWITLIYTLSVDRQNYSNRLRKRMTWRASVRAENIFDDKSLGLLRRKSRTSNVLLGIPAGVEPGEVTGV